MARGRRAPVTGRIVPPEPSVVDLHVHTRRSDGLLLPAELVAAAAAAGIRTLAITDHDTLAGYRDLVAPGAGPLPAGVHVLAGVEINAVAGHLDLPEGELHIVGLGVDPADDAFEAALAGQRGGRRRRFERMAARLGAAGLAVDAQLAGLDPTDDDALGRPTLARALVSAGYASNVQDAFARFVGRGGPGYVPREGLGPIEAIRAIRAAGGLAVVAHFFVAPSRQALLRELMDAGLGGLEVHHRSFDAATVTAVGAVARDLHLVPSGGTDYHGDDETYAEAIAETWIPPGIAAGVLAALEPGVTLTPLESASWPRRAAIVAVLAVALAGTGIATGIALRGSGTGGTESPRTLKPATIVASRDLEPSSDPAVVSWGDKIQVTVPGGLLDRPRTLTIGTLDELPPSPPAFSMLGAYDVSLGDLHELAQPAQIRMAIDPAQLDQGVPASQQLAFFRFDEERSIWEDVPATIDDTALTATLSVTHLSAYGKAKLVAGFQQLATQPIYVHDNPAPHFRVIFDPNLNATFEDPTGIQVTGPQPPKKKVGSNDILRYVYWIGKAAEDAWTAYHDAKLDPPALTDIVVENSSGLLDPAFSWKKCIIEVPTATAIGGWPGLKAAMGHELFHAIESANLGAVMLTNWWFMEAMAEYATGRVASTRTSDSGRLMGQDINARGLTSRELPVLELRPADPRGRRTSRGGRSPDARVTEFRPGTRHSRASGSGRWAAR